jgi:hypothetical protein
MGFITARQLRQLADGLRNAYGQYLREVLEK